MFHIVQSHPYCHCYLLPSHYELTLFFSTQPFVLQQFSTYLKRNIYFQAIFPL